MARTTAERAARPVVRDFVMAALGGIVMLATLVALVSCSSSPKSDPLAEAARALSDTDSQALHVDGDEAETMRAAVERFIALFQDFEPTTIDERARTVYADQAYFNDGFIEVRGIDEIAGYLVRSAEAAGEVAIDVHDVAYGGAEIYVRWDMRFSNRSGSKQVTAPGVSHLRVNSDGQVIFHRDYWDSSGALAEFVPLMSSILRSVRSRL
jgi:limonene-1,2-epoxide hydrolase